jgi:hypothetical protein
MKIPKMDNSDHIEANAKQFRNARLGRCADSLMQLPWRRGILEAMNLTLAHIGARPGSKDEFDAGTAIYLERCSAFAHCKAEAFRTEKALLDWLERQQGRTPVVAVLLDSRGRQMTSEAFAAWLSGATRGRSISSSPLGRPADGAVKLASVPACCSRWGR